MIITINVAVGCFSFTYMTAVHPSNLKVVSPALLLQVIVIHFHSAICLCGKPFGNTKQEYNMPYTEQATMLHSRSYNPSYHHVSGGAVRYKTYNVLQSC
jgi:hypothetical protein